MAQANKPTKPSGSPKLPGFPSGKKPDDGKRAIPWLWIAFGAFFVLQIAFSFFTTKGETISYTELMALLRTEDVDKVTVVNQSTAEVYIKEDKLTKPKYEKLPQSTNRPQYEVEIGSVDAFTEALNGIQKDRSEGDKLQVTFLDRPDYLGVVLSWVIPIGLLLLLWMFLMNRARSNMGGMGGPNGIFNFGKSKAKLVDQSEEKVTFDDVAGLNEIKVEVGEVVDFLKNKEKYTSLGAKIPRGVLLIGPPGTGKTLLARAVAGEAGVPFYSISGSEFVEMFVGVGASRVRDLFKTAKENSPSIVFIDEIDAVGRSRGAANAMQSNDERESTLNQMLTEMDGFGANTGVIVMGATNRGEVLDSALLRPGRFDRQIYLELPTKQEREEILRVHTRDIKLDGEIDLDQLSSQTPGFSGADLANLCNEAALIAARHDKKGVQMQDFMSAADRIIGGLENKSRIITDREKEIIAYHEAGHATASWYLEHADALLKVSIVPRGKSLGAAWYLPTERAIYTMEQFMDRICATLAGRASEEIIFGKISSGALDDLEKITKLAYSMVSFYGLNEQIGNMSYYDSTGQYQRSLQKPYSEATAQLIDQEVRTLIEQAYERTKILLNKHRNQLEELARLLLSKEVVLQNDLKLIFGDRPFGKTVEADK